MIKHMVKTAAIPLALVFVVPTTTKAETVPTQVSVDAGPCNHLNFNSRRERITVNQWQVQTINASCRQLRRIYRNSPDFRDNVPATRHIRSGDRLLPPSPAIDGSTQSVRRCEVWTRVTHKSGWPFRLVLWSLRLTQEFQFDGDTVTAGAVQVEPDTTDNGWPWHFDRFVMEEDVYGLDRWWHQSARMGAWEFIDIPRFPTNWGATLYARIKFYRDGSWSSTGTSESCLDDK